MDQRRMEELKQALSRLDSDELRRIWWENDRETWSEEAFVVARHLLQERGEPIPKQLAKPPEKPPVQEKERKTNTFITILSIQLSFAFVWSKGDASASALVGLMEISVFVLACLVLYRMCRFLVVWWIMRR